ncbi:MAG TPA: serine/threonine-protein kinase, partial [Candidatus Limnocylindria bacterium]|nr:serine/threonine-protein kinase [Candidatus Limnocylindria bacterium]
MRWLSDAALERLRQGDGPCLPDHEHYRVLEEIGRGGMGTVYRAEDVRLGRRVALKVLNLLDPSGDAAARMRREAQILARLEHPGIVPVHDAGTLADGRVFYAMKYVRGLRLDRWVASATSLAERLRLFTRVCEAVAFAHAEGVVHRDLKPENVMVGPFGEVLVMDWGVAKVLADPARDGTGHAGTADPARAPSGPTASTPIPSQPAQTEAGTVLGTPGYMAPEQ